MIASSQQIIVRILTGLHAGAEILLSQGSHEIGSGLDCTVVIADWPVQRSLFTIEKYETGSPLLRFHDAALTAPFGMNQAVCFGNVVIVASECAGDGGQPSDLALLKQLLTPLAVVVPKKRRGAGTWVVGGIVIAVAITATVVVQSPRSAAATSGVRGAALSTLEQVKSTVAKLRYGGVYVAMDGDRIVVAGIVKDRTEAKNLAAQLATLHLDSVEQRYAVESEIAAAISDAIARPGITVKHLGAGRFEIRGDIPPGVMQKIDLKRLKNDLGSVVSSITFQENISNVQALDEMSNLQKQDNYQFKQGGDGVKYFTPR